MAPRPPVIEAPGPADEVTKRCPVCSKFRSYEPGDEYCLVCGHEGLEAHCACGRGYGDALADGGDLHCPRCGRTLRGRSPDFE